MKYVVKNWIFAVVAVAFAAVSITTPAGAALPERSLGISPLRSELTISPGTSFDGKLTLTNSGKQAVSVSLKAEVFSVTNQTYDYAFNPSGTGVDWVSFSKDIITIDPTKSAVITYKVSVPLDAEPGGHYVSLFASSSPSTSVNGVSSVNRVASLLYITVAGDITQTGKVLTFNSPYISFQNPEWTATLQNSGSAHFHSLYSVQVVSLFGKKPLSSTQSDSLILPSSIRLITQAIPHPEWLGVYRLNYTIGLGDVAAQQYTRWMIYLPPLQVALVAGIIAGLFLLRPKRQKTAREIHNT